jgi:hypothetical protein
MRTRASATEKHMITDKGQLTILQKLSRNLKTCVTLSVARAYMHDFYAYRYTRAYSLQDKTRT